MKNFAVFIFLFTMSSPSFAAAESRFQEHDFKQFEKDFQQALPVDVAGAEAMVGLWDPFRCELKTERDYDITREVLTRFVNLEPVSEQEIFPGGIKAQSYMVNYSVPVLIAYLKNKSGERVLQARGVEVRNGSMTEIIRTRLVGDLIKNPQAESYYDPALSVFVTRMLNPFFNGKTVGEDGKEQAVHHWRSELKQNAESLILKTQYFANGGRCSPLHVCKYVEYCKATKMQIYKAKDLPSQWLRK